MKPASTSGRDGMFHQAHVSLLDIQFKLQGMLKAIHGPPSSYRSPSTVPCSPVRPIAVRTPRLACAWSHFPIAFANACNSIRSLRRFVQRDMQNCQLSQKKTTSESVGGFKLYASALWFRRLGPLSYGRYCKEDAGL